MSALPSGVVYLVGAGPGDPGLLTRRGADLIARADVVVYDGLASPVLLRLAPADCERIYAGKKRAPDGDPMAQEEIERVLIDRARAGKRVVRLKGGDPFLFGRGAEECRALVAAGVRHEVVPGVSAATAVPAYAGIPLTARGVASTVAYATGHGKGDTDPAVDWGAVARADTIVLFMALATAADCCARLIAAGRAAQTPAAAIHWGTTASQRVVVSTLAGLPGAIAAAGLRPPSLLVIGDVVALREQLRWFDRRPLAGARVLATRAADQAERFADAVAELGGDPVVAPLLRVVPTGGLERIGDLSAYAWIVFTSANAVDCTASALARRGLRADVVPAHGDAAAVARAVVAAGGDLAGARILLPRADRGRDEAAQLLGAAGAAVDAVAVYRLEPLPASDPAVAHALDRLRRRTVHAVAFFAPSQVRALHDLLGADAAAVLGDVQLLAAIGATTAAALADRGLRAHVVSSSPDAEVLAAEMAAALAGAV